MQFRPLKFSLWLYFALIIVEGMFRKWFLPGFSDVIFLVRDPLVLVIYLLAWREGALRWSGQLMFLWVLVVVCALLAIVNETDWRVVLFGLRTNFLHVPLIFVLGAALDREDARRFGHACLWLTLGITALMVVQFNSPREAFINVGVGARESGQILGAMDRVRPPGPFSFVSGVVMYFSLAGAFVAAEWLQPGRASRWLVVLATVACALAVPVSVSRSLLLALLLIAAFALVVVLRDARRTLRYFAPAAVVVIVLFAATDSIYMQAFETRWQESLVAGGGGFEGNVTGRILDEFTEPFRHALDAPLTGHGIGLGTVAGARLATGKNEFLLAETEWSRIVLELGPIVGFIFIGWRLWLAASLLRRAWSQFRLDGDPLAWLLGSAAFLPLAQAQWGPSTHLGFAVFSAGLCLAALNSPDAEADGEEAAVEEPDSDSP